MRCLEQTETINYSLINLKNAILFYSFSFHGMIHSNTTERSQQL